MFGSSMNPFDLVEDISEIIKRSKPYWKRYINGINMTLMECVPRIDCDWKHDDTLITTIVHEEDIVCNIHLQQDYNKKSLINY